MTGFARLSVAALLVASCAPLFAQGGPAPVGYTEAREIDLRGEVRLPATVVSRLTSTVAGEVAGKVQSVEVQDGERAKKGDVLVRLRPNAVRLFHDEAVARLAESQARLELAKSSLERTRELFASEVVSQQDLDDAVSEFTAWSERESQNRAQVAQLDLNLDLLEVRAPFDGVVTRKLTEVGQWIVAGGAVAEMISLNQLEARVEVPERYYDSVSIGTRTRVTLESLPDLELEGVVQRIIPRAGGQTRTFPVMVAIQNRKGRIGVGMLATVAMPVGSAAKETIVPKDAIVRTGPGQAVYRIAEDGTAEVVEVRTGAGHGAWIAVRGTLQPGDRIVTRGNERLFPGQPVNGTPQEYAAP